MAQQIMVGVRRAGLPLKLDAITPGDDNCFFHAVFAQCQRPSVAQELSGEPPIRGNHDLRLKISRFARNSRLPIIQSFKKLYKESHPSVSWDAFWKRMAKDREWADAIVLQGAAWYLHHDIHVVMASATEKKPLCTFSGSWVTEGAPCDKTPLLLGYLNDLHYQSLHHVEDDLFRPATFQPMSFRDIMGVFLQGLDLKRNKNEAESVREETPHKKSKEDDGVAVDWDFNFLWNTKKLCIKPAKEKGWVCPMCESEEKQIMRHMKKQHITKPEMESFAALEQDYKKHAQKLKQRRLLKRKMEEDPEGTRAKHREEEKLSKQKRKAADPEGFKTKHREEVESSRQKRKAADPEGFKAKQRTEKQRSLLEQEERDPAGFANRKWEASKRNFLQEIRFGPFFGCESCEIFHFRHNVVKITFVLIQQIGSSATDASIREYNSKIEQVRFKQLSSKFS